MGQSDWLKKEGHNLNCYKLYFVGEKIGFFWIFVCFDFFDRFFVFFFWIFSIFWFCCFFLFSLFLSISVFFFFLGGKVTDSKKAEWLTEKKGDSLTKVVKSEWFKQGGKVTDWNKGDWLIERGAEWLIKQLLRAIYQRMWRGRFWRWSACRSSSSIYGTEQHYEVHHA